jgi:hypothetical protein
VEDAPALDALNKFEVMEKNGGVYVKGEESAIKGGRRIPNVTCKSQGEDKVVVVGGYVKPRPCLSSNCRTKALFVSSVLELELKFHTLASETQS